MDTELLRTFLAIADAGSFTRAAQAVHRSQSAVSMQVRRLEDLVSEPLFRRTAQGVVLTARGEALAVDARRILGLLDDCLGGGGPGALDGLVRIGIPEEYGTDVLPEALARFADAHPSVQVFVRCEPSERFPAALERGEVDVAVLVEEPGRWTGDVLFEDPTVWVAAERGRIHDRDPLPLAMFDAGCWWRDVALRALGHVGRAYRVVYASPSVAGVQAAVAAGLAVGVLGASTVRRGMRTLGHREGFPALPGSNVAVRYASRNPPEAIRRMGEAVGAALRLRNEAVSRPSAAGLQATDWSGG